MFHFVNVVLLGVVEKQLQNEVFQAEMERKLAQLLSEVSTRRRMWRRATVAAGNSVVQVLLKKAKRGGKEGTEICPKTHGISTQMEDAMRNSNGDGRLYLVASERGSISVRLESRHVDPWGARQENCVTGLPCHQHDLVFWSSF